MAVRGVNFKWYDGFFLFMLAISVVIVAVNWERYNSCTYPLHIWIVVDYTTVFTFRILMFVDNGIASGLGLDFGRQQRYARFCGRIVVLSILVLLLYPFLWAWTIIGSLWFCSTKNCLPGEGQKWGFLIWLLFSYCALTCIACVSMGKWLARRHAHFLGSRQGIPISEYRAVMVQQPVPLETAWDMIGSFVLCKFPISYNELNLLRFNASRCWVLVEMIQVPDWAFEAAGQETRGMDQDAAAYHPGLFLTPAQKEAVEALIQELPKFKLKAVPTDCSECLICLEEFHVGNEVRGLPCAHNFHVECIDQWLRLNVKCPRCRSSVFPNLDLSALSIIRVESEQSSASVVTTTRYVRGQSSSQIYFSRSQGLVHPVRAEIARPVDETDNGLENTENGVAPVVT